jgi:myo-inositol 2-dehydrogenase/D-chiro-inositol 1-dehydrogenase
MALEVAMVGAGRMGAVHAASLAAIPGARLALVADPDLERATTLAERLGADATDDIEAALTSNGVGAVAIASPTEVHVEQIELAAAAGKSIFCEKPVGLDDGEVARCLETVSRHGAYLQIGFHRRFDTSFRGVKEAIEGGQVGEVLQIVLTSRDPEPPHPGYVEGSGGLFRDMGVHDADLARWYLGEEPIEVMAFGSNLVDPAIGAAGDIDIGMALLRTDRGALCHINLSRLARYGYDQRVEVLGTLGMAQAQNRTPASVEVATAAGVSSTSPHYWFPQRYADAYRAEVEAFVEAVTGGAPPPVTGEDGQRAQLIVSAATESLHSGRPVSIG